LTDIDAPPPPVPSPVSSTTATTAAIPAVPRQRRGHGRATLRDVAAAAGVTAITVSRYLRAPAQVSPDTAEAIRGALAATGYVPNKQAGVLASGRGSIVAALVPNLAHSIFAETLQGLAGRLEAAGLELLVASSGYSAEREEAQVRALLGWAPRALVVTGRHHTPGAQRLLREAHAGGCTVVEMWDHHARGAERFAQVGFNHRAVGRAMAAHLLALGHRRLAYVDSAVAGDYRARERGDGFVAAAEAAGASAVRVPAPAGEPIAAGREVVPTLLALRPRPTAVGFANDHLGCGALLGAQAAGVAVPGALALIGFGDFELAAHLAPGLTTLAPPRREIGERVAELLLADGGAAPRLRLDCPLVVRGSTGG
jgi:LacI family transcriptional regulator, gluconate utilization system Gnt-I transcriptional repressor